jgi:hypothetical protein
MTIYIIEGIIVSGLRFQNITNKHLSDHRINNMSVKAMRDSLATRIAYALGKVDNDRHIRDYMLHDLPRLSLEQLNDPAKVYSIFRCRVAKEGLKPGLFLHGSGSASLAFVSEEGLKPLGIMLKEGKVPFLGEVSTGSIGINQENISTLSALHEVSQYNLRTFTTRGCRGWSVEKSCGNILGYREQIKKLRSESTGKYGRTEEEVKNKLRKYLDSAEDNYNTTTYDNMNSELCILRYIRVYEQAIRIEGMRQEQWKSLDQVKRKAVSEPFSVIYLIEYEGKTSFAFSDYKEYLIPGTIPPDKIVAFVPKDKLGQANELTKGRIRIMSEDKMGLYIAFKLPLNDPYMKAIKKAISSIIISPA